MDKKKYSTVSFPDSRIGTFDVGKIGSRKHHVQALIEIDVSEARKLLKSEKRVRKISFTAWLLKVISQTLVLHKEVCGYLAGANHKVVFDNISITITVEKSISGVNVPVPLLIEDVNLKSIEEITREIEEAGELKIGNKNDTVISKNNSRLLMRLYYLMPQLIRIFFLRRILNNPFRAKKRMGNVMFTSLGMAGRFPGWILPKSYHNLCFAIGSIMSKPWVVNNRIEIREIMHMSILIDHDVVDGRAMARFVSDLVKNIEKGMFINP